MSVLLRVEMVIAALLVMVIIVHNVNKKKLRLQYSFFWLVIVAGMLIVSFFPGIADWLCGVMQIQTPSNLIYLFGILILLFISFYQTTLISKQADQIARLTQIVSIERYISEKKEKNHINSGYDKEVR